MRSSSSYADRAVLAIGCVALATSFWLTRSPGPELDSTPVVVDIVPITMSTPPTPTPPTPTPPTRIATESLIPQQAPTPNPAVLDGDDDDDD